MVSSVLDDAGQVGHRPGLRPDHTPVNALEDSIGDSNCRLLLPRPHQEGGILQALRILRDGGVPRGGVILVLRSWSGCPGPVWLLLKP